MSEDGVMSREQFSQAVLEDNEPFYEQNLLKLTIPAYTSKTSALSGVLPVATIVH